MLNYNSLSEKQQQIQPAYYGLTSARAFTSNRYHQTRLNIKSSREVEPPSLINQSFVNVGHVNQEVFTPLAAQNKIFENQQTSEPHRCLSLGQRTNLDIAQKFVSVSFEAEEPKK